jgi:hypothetical protein
MLSDFNFANSTKDNFTLKNQLLYKTFYNIQHDVLLKSLTYLPLHKHQSFKDILYFQNCLLIDNASWHHVERAFTFIRRSRRFNK